MPATMFPGDRFSTERRLAWVRGRAQAEYRGEDWRITWADFCVFWPTEERWQQRGRHTEALVLSRFDYEKPWTRKNCCIITRYQHLCASRARRAGKDMNQYYKGALTYGQ